MGLADLRPQQFPRDTANRLRRGQIRGTVTQMRVMLASNTFFAPILSMQGWNHGINELVIGWTLGMLIFSWVLFFSWRKTFETDGSAKDMQAFVFQTFLNSSLWMAGMALFYPVAGGDEKAIITTVMAGSLALGTLGFSRTPSAAFAYLGVQMFGGCFIALATAINNNSMTDYLISFLSVTAGISVFNATLERGRSGMVAFRNHESLTEKTEVVDLLLKDYEQQATEWLWQTDPDGHILSAPATILEMLGAPAEGPDNNCLVTLVTKQHTPQSRKDVQRLAHAFGKKEEFHDIHLSFLHPVDQQIRWIVMKGRPQFLGGAFRGYRGIFADATVAIEAKRQIQFMAAHDTLTGLHNRNSVQEHLSDIQAAGTYSTAFLIDLDGFKQVNDSYGHHIGDLLLKAVAERLRDLQTPDILVARLGGDEFFLLKTDETAWAASSAQTLADDIVRSLSEEYVVESFHLQLSASVGIACCPGNTEKGSDLLLMADLALYEAKNNGRNCSRFFEVGLQNALNERLEITEKLKIAIRQGSIRPFYQSQHSLANARLIGFEALARWFDDELGSIGPDIFIPIAEQTGLIVELGEQILRQSCLDAVAWARYAEGPSPIVSVNLSPVQFARTDVVDVVAGILRESGLRPELLEIEVTEGVLISDKEKVASALRELSALGVSIALDDFGTGYSSLSYLKALPLNRLKIDQSFVCDLQLSSANPIVETVIQLGKNMGLSVIAEGIETAQQADTLAKLHCTDGQGYFYGRPAPFATACETVVRDAKSRRSLAG